jgi:glycosyltransferase involved in cell wall biosynthesis
LNKILFYSHVKDLKLFDTVAYYEQDIRILRELNFDVHVTNRISDLFFQEYDLIYVWWWTYSIFAVIASRLKKKKLIIAGAFHYKTPLMEGTDFVRRSLLYKFLVRIGLYFSHANLFISNIEYHDVKVNLPVRNPYIISCIVDSQKYSARSKKKALSHNKKVPYRLTVVSWLEKHNMERKRIFQLMDVVKALHEKGLNVHFDVCGRPGSGYNELEAHVRNLSISDLVTFHGNVTEEKKIEILHKTDLYLAPTLYEGFGLAVAEAMACECAVLTSANGAITEVVGDAGAYADPMSIDSMTNVCYDLLKNEKKRLLLGKSGRQRILNNFNMEKKKLSLLQVFKDLGIEL